MKNKQHGNARLGRIALNLGRWLVALATGWLVPGLARAATPVASNAPNIILIVADDLGYGDLGCYGQREIQTPNLDRLAREGVRFTQFYTGVPVCAPARNTLLTGEHSGHTLLRANSKIPLRAQDRTVAEVLRQAGYLNGMTGKWGLGLETGDGSPSARGFDYFFGYIDQTMAHNYYPAYLVRNREHVPLRNVVPDPGLYGEGATTKKVDYSADLIAADAVAFLERNRDRPFTLFFTTTLPHVNHEAVTEVPNYGRYADRPWPEADKGYAAMITKLDDHVGMLLAKLEQLNLADRTIVVFTSDNGPEIGHDAKRFASSGGLRGMKRDLYEGGIRVPLIVRWPGHTQPGTTSDFIGYFPDFMPTLAEVAGASAPKRDGISFVAALEGRSNQATHPYLYWEFYERATSQAVRMGKWKAVRSPLLTGAVELYDLSEDLAEAHNVAAQHPDIVNQAVEYMREAHVPSPLWQVPVAAPPTGGLVEVGAQPTRSG